MLREKVFIFVVEKNLMDPKVPVKKLEIFTGLFTPGPFGRSGWIFCPRRRKNRRRTTGASFDGVRNARSDRKRRHVC